MRQATTIVDPSLSRLWFDSATRPLAGDPGRYAALGIRTVRLAFPTLTAALHWRAAGREILLHVQADNYDHLPPRGWWVDDADMPLQAGMVPVGGGFQQPPNPYGEAKAWLCFPGWREYHDHQSHQDNPWPQLRARGGYGLSAILVQLAHDLNKAEVTAP